MTARLHLAAALAAFLAAGPAAATGPQLYLSDGTAGLLELRAAPSAEAGTVGRLDPAGPGVAVLERDETGAWGHVEWQGRDAWLPMENLRPAFRFGPELFRVTGVAADDVLNIRAAPSASAPILGGLAPGATVEVLDAGPEARWGRIVHAEGNGWVALRYLAPVEPERVGATRVPVGLACTGTEPFWSLRTTGPASLDWQEPEAAPRTVPVDLATVAAGREAWPAALRGPLGEGDLLATLRPAACSDGMSDRLYGWTVEVVAGDRLLTGCCRYQSE